MSEGVSEFESRSVLQGWCKHNGKHFPLSRHQKWKLFHVCVRGPLSKPLSQFIKLRGPSEKTIVYVFNVILISFLFLVKRWSISLQVHQLMNSDFVGVQVSWCLSSINNVWIPRCSEALRQTNRSFRGVSEPRNPIPVRCVDSGTKTCSHRPQRDGHFADMTVQSRRGQASVSRHVTLPLHSLFTEGRWDVVLKLHKVVRLKLSDVRCMKGTFLWGR